MESTEAGSITAAAQCALSAAVGLMQQASIQARQQATDVVCFHVPEHTQPGAVEA